MHIAEVTFSIIHSESASIHENYVGKDDRQFERESLVLIEMMRLNNLNGSQIQVFKLLKWLGHA